MIQDWLLLFMIIALVVIVAGIITKTLLGMAIGMIMAETVYVWFIGEEMDVCSTKLD